MGNTAGVIMPAVDGLADDADGDLRAQRPAARHGFAQKAESSARVSHASIA